MRRLFQGQGVSKGYGDAPAYIFRKADYSIPPECGSPDAESSIFTSACNRVCADNEELRDQAERQGDTVSSGIFDAHVLLLEDEDSVLKPGLELISGGMSAAQAVDSIFQELIAAMESLRDEYKRQRADDFRDLRGQLLQVILGVSGDPLRDVSAPVIIVADNMLPSDTARLDPELVAGFVCQEGGSTSHTSILARTMGIPAVANCRGVMDGIRSGDRLLIDGSSGRVISSPSAEDIDAFGSSAAEFARRQQLLKAYADRPTVTSDGRRAELLANISSPDECSALEENGCEGVGLFRSEFLYMGRDTLPSEEEQLQAYSRALRLANGRPVTVRTLDAGGDKGIPNISLGKEDNPFLGYRAIRICLDHPGLFKTQLRALYRAGVWGELRIMLPMIASVSELRRARAIAEEVRCELAAEGVPAADNVPLGIMIEIPAAAVMSDLLAKECDFFSIGTNDLIQYTMAADRGNTMVAAVYSPYDPGVLRLIARTIKSAHEAGIPCGMCGEAAADPGLIPIFLGFGLDEFSMAAAEVTGVRAQISTLDHKSCEALCRKVLTADSAAAVKELIRSAFGGTHQ